VKLSMKLTGSVELQKKLDQLSMAMAAQALATAVTAGALVIENAAKQRSPVRTGNLRRSIHTEPARAADGKAATARVGTNVEYAPYVEFGTRRMSARPYLRPALDEGKAEAQRVMAVAFKRAIEKAVP
jgi:HK97 gp10 family phage protein